ncbi:MAG: glycerophosphodiester phosphodiesterase family protein, partial [Bacteroidota bacterium]
NVDQNLDELGYLPNIYSPHWGLLNDTIIQHLHDKGIRVIPWTVNDPQVMKRLVEQGVDGIITDYPNLIPSI